MGRCVLPGAGPCVEVWRGLAEMLRFLWAVLKIAVGTLLRGRGGGSLGAGWGCLAPSSSCQALCEEVLQVHRIQIWEGPGAPPPTSLPAHTSRSWRPRAEKGLFSSHQAWGQGSRRWAHFLPALSEGHLRSHEASLAALGAQGLGTLGTGCGLPS